MSSREEVEGVSAEAWHWAVVSAAIYAMDPRGISGVVVAGPHGPVRDRWLALLARFRRTATEPVCVPVQITDDRLLGGIDLAATLSAGRPVSASGVLAQADGGEILVPGAERLSQVTQAKIACALDTKSVSADRCRSDDARPARFGFIALDEAMDDEQGLTGPLFDRAAMRVDLTPVVLAHCMAPVDDRFVQHSAAMPSSETIAIASEQLNTLCQIAQMLGITSLRPALAAAKVARAHAALNSRDDVQDDDLEAAVRLCFAWRATQVPDFAPEPPAQRDTEQNETPEAETNQETSASDMERSVDAVRAILPADLLKSIIDQQGRSRQRGAAGQSGSSQRTATRGRRVGVRRGDPRTGGVLSIHDTLIAAAPMQKLRRGHVRCEPGSATRPRLQIRSDDFRIHVHEQRRKSLTIFVVDASGSTALQRLGEAKGAVELLLGDCYVRRDEVALIAFRGTSAQVLLPPTSALARAKRCLAVLPGGGGTPLASGIAEALQLAESGLRRGQTPTIVLLTDGRANIARDGTPGRAEAGRDASAEAARLKQSGIRSLIIDTSARPQDRVARFAEETGGTYLPLPRADVVAVKDMIARTASS